MQKIIHYFKCFQRLVKKYAVYFLNSVILAIKKAFAVIGLYLCVYGNVPQNDEKTLDLKTIYPDTGHLCNSTGFQFDECKYDLSIIIPTYNLSKYVDECICSVLQQNTSYTYEVIIVDDGSTDDTLQKIEKFKTNNVSIIRQENSGQSAARNRAISMSKGRYLMFVDGDDVLLPNAIEHLVQEAFRTRSDIVEGNIVRYYNAITDEMIMDSTTKPYIKSYLNDPRFVLSCYGYSVGKIYRRELWRTLRFPEGYIFEDIITKFILRRKANCVVFTGVPVYGYRYNQNSSTHGKEVPRKLDSIWVFPKIVELCSQEGTPKDGVFYMLSLNHIGLLNYVVIRNCTYDIKAACFNEMRSQLISIQHSRPQKMPIMFKLLEESILHGDLEIWEKVTNTIFKYDMLKKWRERN